MWTTPIYDALVTLPFPIHKRQLSSLLLTNANFSMNPRSKSRSFKANKLLPYPPSSQRQLRPLTVRREMDFVMHPEEGVFFILTKNFFISFSVLFHTSDVQPKAEMHDEEGLDNQNEAYEMPQLESLSGEHCHCRCFNVHLAE
jgi:hypothetical protein